MNLMVVSEKHGLMIIGVDYELFIYQLDPITMTLCNSKKYKKISLQNDNVFLDLFNILYSKRSIT